jgi:hypothetical protein
VEGGPMERDRICLDAVGACVHLIAREELGGAENQKSSHRGSMSPGRCVMEAGEGGVRFNGGE